MNKEIPLVSVSVVTYNHEKYIEQCLDSILNQKTDFVFEIILGEDDSTDGTRAICNRYAANHPDKIRLFLRSREDVIYINGNPTGRFNFIENLKSVRSEYIALCEGDDYWTDPLKLQKQVDFLEANDEYQICFHESAVEWNEENSTSNIKLNSQFPWNKMNVSKDVYKINDVLDSPFMATASVVFRKYDFKEFPSWFYRAASGDISLYALIIGDKKIKFINETMCVYRRHAGGVTRFHKGNFIILNRIETLKNISKYYSGAYDVAIKKSISNYLEGVNRVNYKEFLTLLKLYFTSRLIRTKYLVFFFKKGVKAKLNRLR
jgi:glycosyltransferase involved in cell wall biosynthesis